MTGLDNLTERKREIVALVAAGYSNAAIADALFISEKTVKNHITEIRERCDVTLAEGRHPRVMLARWAWRQSDDG